MDKINQELTLGEQRVRVSFNATGNGVVDIIKKDTAELIDMVESLKQLGNGNVNSEKIRLIALAQTKYEEAAMFAVKAATI